MELYRQMGNGIPMGAIERALSLEKHEYVTPTMQEKIRNDFFKPLWRENPSAEKRYGFLTQLLYNYTPNNDRNARIDAYFKAVMDELPVHSGDRMNFILQFKRYISQTPPRPGSAELQIEANKQNFMHNAFKSATDPVSIVFMYAVNCELIN